MIIKRHLLLPWQKKHTVICPKCGGKIETRPLWYWEKQTDKLQELQHHFCHALDPEFLEKIPVLTENDWKSKLAWDAFRKDLVNDFGRLKPDNEIEDMLIVRNGPPKIFVKHGSFPWSVFLPRQN